MMKNKVELTDDELSVIATSLLLSVQTYEKYLEVHGESGLDWETKEACKKMEKLLDRLEEEYF